MPDTIDIDPAAIEPSPNNPRMVFDPEDQRRLRESIDEVGILVPLTVYSKDDGTGYRLIDGERRLKCALELGMTSVPGYVVDGVDETTELEWMFSIHMMREAWPDGPVAKALRDLADRLGGWDTDQLKSITGLSTQRLNYYRSLAEAPPEILDRVIAGEIPPNLVADSVLRVSRPLREELPELSATRDDETVIRAMVGKRGAGRLPDIVALRDLRTMIRIASQEADSEQEAAEIRTAIERVLDNPGETIEEAYEDTVGTRIAADAFARAIERFQRAATRVVNGVLGRAEQRATLADQLEGLSAYLRELADRLRRAT